MRYTKWLPTRGPDRRSGDAPLKGDLAMLLILATLSVAPYVLKIAFYSDDWGFLSMFLNSADQSLSGLLAAQYQNANLRMRPLQMVYKAVLFRAFGLSPVGYQIVNAAVLASAVLLIYAIACDVGLPRTVARAVAAVYLLLPNYSTDRFWFAAFGYTLTSALFLLSTYASLRALRGDRFVLWFGVALLTLAASLLGMEIVFPLSLLLPAVLWLRARSLFPDGLRAHLGTANMVLLFACPMVTLAAALWYKAENAVGAAPADMLRLVRLTIGALSVNFGTFGLALPHTTAWSIRQLTPVALVLPCILGALVFVWLLQGDPPPGSRRFWMLVIAAGAVVFALDTAIFVVTPRIGFWSTGISNRVWIAASLGMAAVLVGVAGWWTSLFRGLARPLFSASVALLCLSGFVINVAIAQYWIAAWPQQLDVLGRMQRALPHPRSGTTLLLYGACPYIGSAIVFESWWDFAGARKVLYRDPTLTGDVLDDARSGRFGITDDGIWTRLYGELRFYRFGPNLLLLDYQSEAVHELANRESAIAALSHGTDCPPGFDGGGTVSLPFDTWYSVTSEKISGRLSGL